MSSTTAIPARLPAPDRDRWTVLRAGIQNVWEYDDREFVFNRGRLLLRGQNEAGKTKAMELLFPFLLDADLAPQRLDPFGTTSRPMRWNLINEADPDAQLRIGYLWLELGRREAGKAVYCTIGAGVKARRGSSDVDAWFFLTSQRPGVDIRFLADRPLVKGELTQAIGTQGQVFERHGDYRHAVNARLFGMPDEQYAALVETLLHLRRPQLSKTLDLDQLSRFLSASLPPLDARVVGPIAEGFERLDHHRADLEALEETLGKLRGFDKVYREYARAVAKGRAQELARAESAYQRARSQTRERATELDALITRRETVEKSLEDLGVRERTLAERIRALQDSDAYRAAKALDDEEQAARRAAKAAEEAGRRTLEDEGLFTAASARSIEAARDAKECREDLERARLVATERAKDAAIAGAHGAIDTLAEKGEAEGASGTLRAIRAQRDVVIGRLRHLAGELSNAVEAHRRAEERAGERANDLGAAREALRDAEQRCAEAEERWSDAAGAWLDGLRVLSRDTLPAVEREVSPNPAAFRSAVDSAAEPARRSIAGERASSAARLDAVRVEEQSVRAERDTLVRSPHATPTAPLWRAARSADRPGAPLYILCDFGPAAAANQAAIEAALESSGLLDAWVEPDGTLLDSRTEDVILRADSLPTRGRSLADVLAPVAAGGVAEERVRNVLGCIGFVEAGETADASTWIGEDGRWRVGPLHGSWTKAAPAYVGATARERERARRIAELDARLRNLGESALEHEREANAAEERLELLAREVGSVPEGAEVERARTRVGFSADAHSDAHAKHVIAERSAKEAEAARTSAAAALDGAARAEGLAAFARGPDLLAERSRAYFEAGESLVAVVRDLKRAAGLAEREERAAREAGERAGRSHEYSTRASGDAAAAATRVAALRESSGKERDEVLAALELARGEEREARQAKEGADLDLRGLGEKVGEARKAAEQAESAVAEREEDRKTAAAAFRALADLGVLQAAGFPAPGPPSEWSFTASLEHARMVDAEIEVGAKPEEREKSENRLITRQNELAAQLPPDVRVIPTRSSDVLAYQFTWNGRTRPAAEVMGEMEADAAARIALLGEEESKLLEEFLSGEAHDHLASRLREARALVDRMNAAIEGRTTAAGAQVRLDWSLDDAAQADAREAVPLFLHAGRLLSEANRKSLRAFLQRRLAQAREAQGDRSLQDRLLGILDYRTWHRFQVEHRTPGQPWSKLTRKAHAAGSGGKKAVMLHLPLFAAAAAFYDSANRAAPRVIALDEVFAGIDRPTRGKLMGLLAEFDLDFIMTSYEEWGFYEELDGLSTYHLSREPGHRGVFAEWFVWNGRERVLMEES
jgi:uncharacterized protein (TIGR02680 family)